MTKTLNLSWRRFGFGFAVIGIFPALIVVASINNQDSWPANVAICFLFLSLVSFFSLGWARLRRANSAQPILVTDSARILRLLVGPVFPAAAWFSITFLAVVAIVVASAFIGRAA